MFMRTTSMTNRHGAFYFILLSKWMIIILQFMLPDYNWCQWWCLKWTVKIVCTRFQRNVTDGTRKYRFSILLVFLLFDIMIDNSNGNYRFLIKCIYFFFHYYSFYNNTLIMNYKYVFVPKPCLICLYAVIILSISKLSSHILL